MLTSCNENVCPNILKRNTIMIDTSHHYSHLGEKVIFLLQPSAIFQNIFEAFMLFLKMFSTFSMLAKFHFLRLKVIFENHSEPRLVNKVALQLKTKTPSTKQNI